MDVLETQYKENPPVNFIQEGLKIGLINGAFALILLYGSYFMGMDTFVNVQLVSTFLPYMIIVLLIYGFQLRRRNNNLMTFKEGLQFTFMSYVIAAIMVALGTYILFNYIDRDLTQKTFDIAVEKTRSMMEGLNQSDEEIDKAIAEMEKGRKETNLRTVFLGTGQGLIWDFVKSLLIALIIKREKPVF